MRLIGMLLRPLPSVAALLLLAGAVSAAPVSFTVDSATMAGPGYLDFQFNGGFEAAEAIATVSGFSLAGGGTLLSPVDTVFPLPFNTPTASGSLETVVTISNAESFNAFLQRLDFGSRFRFLVTLSGSALDTTGNGGGTDFTLLSYDEEGNVTDGGPLLVLAIGPDAEITASAATGVSVQPIPEPTSLLAVASALAFLSHAARRRMP